MAHPRKLAACARTLIGGNQDRAVAVGHANRIGFEFVPGLKGAIEHGARGGSERAGVEVGESGGEHVFGVSGLPCWVGFLLGFAARRANSRREKWGDAAVEAMPAAARKSRRVRGFRGFFKEDSPEHNPSPKNDCRSRFFESGELVPILQLWIVTSSDAPPLPRSSSSQSSPKSSMGCCVRMVPLPQRRSSAGQ